MTKFISILSIAMAIISCDNPPQMSSINPENWGKRTIALKTIDSLDRGETYLSVYSQIYSFTEHRTHNLTATISMRNTCDSDSIYLLKARYFNTNGQLLRTYFDKPIFLAPLETVEIIIDENDQEGGTGANFIFDWAIKKTTSEPLFEGIMISTSGQQGLSFTTQGKRVK